MEIVREIVPFLNGPIIIHLGTCNNKFIPFSTRVVGTYLDSDDHHLILFILKERANITIDNLISMKKGAVLFIDPISYKSIQVKGKYIDSWDCSREEEQRLDEYFQKLQQASLPQKYYLIKHKPAVAVKLFIQELYNQSPGPAAGQLMALEEEGDM